MSQAKHFFRTDIKMLYLILIYFIIILYLMLLTLIFNYADTIATVGCNNQVLKRCTISHKYRNEVSNKIIIIKNIFNYIIFNTWGIYFVIF
jgi:hypothetical protein